MGTRWPLEVVGAEAGSPELTGAQVYPSGRQVAVGLPYRAKSVLWDTEGTLWVTGTPTLDPETRAVRITDFDYALASPELSSVGVNTIEHRGLAGSGPLSSVSCSAAGGPGHRRCRTTTRRTSPPRWHDIDTLPDDFHAVSSFSRTDHHNAPFTADRMADKVAVVDFFFTFCGTICPTLTLNMARIDASLPGDADVVLLSHTVAPEHDTPSKLGGFAKRSNITSSRWFLLTGERSELYRQGREVYFAEGSLGKNKGDDDFLPTESMVFVDRDGHLRGIYNGLDDAAVDQLIADATVLLGEG